MHRNKKKIIKNLQLRLLNDSQKQHNHKDDELTDTLLLRNRIII